MIEPQQGFSIDDADYRWGTLPGDVAAVGALPAAIGYVHREVPCRTIFGLAATGATISSPAADRPVMSIAYELASPWLLRGGEERWLAPLQARFGAPDAVDRDDLKHFRDPSSGVACWARWHWPSCDMGLSIYGGIRRLPSGRSAGLVSVSWGDTIAAAAPFVPAWRAASAALEQAGQSLHAMQRFVMPDELRPAGGIVEKDDAEAHAALRAMHTRTILATPLAIRAQLDRKTLALWQSADGQPALSSLWDTVVLRGVKVGWHEVRPAKGGGMSELSVEGWYLRMPYGTPAIAQAAAALKALPSVVVELSESYDV